MFNGLPLDSFVCQNPTCPAAHCTGRGNIKLRKRYGAQQRRLLRCTVCSAEFSELKGRPYWNARCSQTTVDDIVHHVSLGNCFVTTGELVGCHRTTIARIVRVAGQHAQQFHDLHARDLQVTSMQADERYGFVGSKKQPAWDATVTLPRSKFLVQGEVGERTAILTPTLLVQAKARLADPHGLVLFTDGFLSYQTLFAELFGTPYRPARQGKRGRFPKVVYGIPRTAAHVRIIKEYAGKRVVRASHRSVGWNPRARRRRTGSSGVPHHQHLSGGATERNGEKNESSPGQEKPRLREACDPPGEAGAPGTGGLQLVPDAAWIARDVGRAEGSSAVSTAHPCDGHWGDRQTVVTSGVAVTAAGRDLSGMVPANYLKLCSPGIRKRNAHRWVGR